MQTKVTSILNNINRVDKKLNILTISTHERYEQNLAKTGHNFFALNAPNLKKWNRTYANVPSNYTLLDGSQEQQQIPSDIIFDLVLCQYRFIHWNVLAPLADRWGIPIVAIEHILLHPNDAESMRKDALQLRAKRNVFISYYNSRVWGYSPNDHDVDIVYHGVDTDTFSPQNIERSTPVLSVVNEMKERGWAVGFDIWQQIIQLLPNQLKLVGDNKGISRAANSISELVTEYNSAEIFLNTSTFSPIPTVLLEAMSCGRPVVSTNTCMIPEVIQHGYNGMLYNTPEEAVAHIQTLQANPDVAAELGRNARKTILEQFHIKDFTKNWNQVFEKAIT